MASKKTIGFMTELKQLTAGTFTITINESHKNLIRVILDYFENL